MREGLYGSRVYIMLSVQIADSIAPLCNQFLSREFQALMGLLGTLSYCVK